MTNKQFHGQVKSVPLLCPDKLADETPGDDSTCWTCILQLFTEILNKKFKEMWIQTQEAIMSLKKQNKTVKMIILWDAKSTIW